MAIFIALEGLSGVGKSTIAPLLARRLNARVVATIPSDFQGLRDCFPYPEGIDARFCFFAAAVLTASLDVKRALSQDINVVVDSYIYRTCAFHIGMGAQVTLSMHDAVIKPTQTFWLTCGDAERRERVANRGRVNPWAELAESKVNRIIEQYRRFPMVEVNTTDRRIDEVVEKIMRHVASPVGLERV
jgi:thymidylate kinase